MESANQTPKLDIRPSISPLIASLPPHLKDPANFERIQKEVLNTFISTCGHSDVLEWSSCKKCTEKMINRRLLLRKLGFKNPGQYMIWRKIHEEIKTRMPLVDWKSRKTINFK